MLFLLGSSYKFSDQKLFNFQVKSIKKLQTFKDFNSKYLNETGRFIECLNDCHLEMKKDFELKALTMMESNNSIQTEFYKISSIR
jgi:hypothetical protein